MKGTDYEASVPVADSSESVWRRMSLSRAESLNGSSSET
jgi:hypothetical protein